MIGSTIKHIATVFPVNVEALKSETKLQQHRVIIKDFSLNTSTHGIPGIARSQSISNLLFWSISFITFLGIMLYFIIQSILAYYSYPTQTSVSTINEWPQAFPAVTVCNNSPFRYDTFIGPYLNYTNSLNLTNTTDTTTFTEQQALYISDYLQYKLNRNESVNEFYYPLSSMLIKCVYNGVNCSAADFVQFTSSTYGLCYTFNAQASHINNDTIHYNNENGGSGELQLDLYIHSHQYVPYLTDAMSIVTMVHDNTQLPLIDRLGIQMMPGRKHKLGYSVKTNTFLPAPYTACTETITLGMQAMFDQFSNAKYAYAQQICFSVAMQSYTYDQCGCVSPYEWSYRYVISHGATNIIYATLCNISDPCYSKAAVIFQASVSVSNDYAANCGLECTTNQYVLELSSALAPASWYMNSIKQFVESSSIPLPSNWLSTWSNEIQNNYVSLDIVCATTVVESYTQQATLGGVDVISNIGGQTGLWIGISFLSLMEFAEMLFRLIRHQVYLIREKIHRTRRKISETEL
ncbi:unnamed protein product [Adineta steineri]|uniref:Uncharacterized protein n=1 Tax=Adineta steineri TaxID=433720 RepID=A0A814EG26_9BILA|nr:unnamed protein product [Adineta steineri]